SPSWPAEGREGDKEGMPSPRAAPRGTFGHLVTQSSPLSGPVRVFPFVLFASLWLTLGMETLPGNAVVAQSGGPTALITASAWGVLQGPPRRRPLGDVYGANTGTLGIVPEDLFALRAESADTVEGLRSPPSSAVGSCRYKLGDLSA